MLVGRLRRAPTSMSESDSAQTGPSATDGYLSVVVCRFGLMFLKRPCGGCGGPIRGDGWVLPGASRPRSPRVPLCQRCVAQADPVGPVRGIPGLCGGGVLYRYDGPVQRAIVVAKAGGRPDVFVAFGRQLATLVNRDPGAEPPSLVTWVPASRAGVRQRGVDQGRLLARGLAGVLGCRHGRLLARGADASRLGRGRADRLLGPDVYPRGPVNGSVLLVDDVITTGASMTAAVAAAKGAGAASVVGLAVAWAATPHEAEIGVIGLAGPGSGRHARAPFGGTG